MSGKESGKGRKRPAHRSGGPVMGGQRRANAIDAIVESAQRGNRDTIRERDIVRR